MNNNVLEWMTAVGTLLSALVALGVVLYVEFKEKINKAVLVIRDYVINPCSVYEAMIGLAPEERFGTVEIKLPIEQIAGGIAINVEIILRNIWKFNEKGNKEKWPYYISSNLTWGDHKNKIISQRFSKGIARYCNLGFYGIDSEENYSFKVATAEVIGDAYTDMLSEDLPSGKYELELVLCGENVASLNKSVSLEIIGGWRKNREESFDGIIKIKIL